VCTLDSVQHGDRTPDPRLRIPKITEILAANRDHGTASYRLVLGAVEALATMAQADRCLAYKQNPALRRDVEAHAGIKEETLTAATRKALSCPP